MCARLSLFTTLNLSVLIRPDNALIVIPARTFTIFDDVAVSSPRPAFDVGSAGTPPMGDHNAAFRPATLDVVRVVRAFTAGDSRIASSRHEPPALACGNADACRQYGLIRLGRRDGGTDRRRRYPWCSFRCSGRPRRRGRRALLRVLGGWRGAFLSIIQWRDSVIVSSARLASCAGQLICRARQLH